MAQQRRRTNAYHNALGAGAAQVIEDEIRGGGVQSANPWSLNFIATRESNNILDALYFFLFGAINTPTSYYRVGAKLEILPVVGGVVGSLVMSVEAITGDLLFTYTLGAGTDIVRVASQGRNSASEWLEMIRCGASFSSPGFRETYSKDNFAAQFQGISIQSAVNTVKGISAQDTYVVDPSISPDQFKDKRLDVMLQIDADSYYTLANGFIDDAAVANPQIGMYFFDPIWELGGAFDRGADCF